MGENKRDILQFFFANEKGGECRSCVFREPKDIKIDDIPEIREEMIQEELIREGREYINVPFETMLDALYLAQQKDITDKDMDDIVEWLNGAFPIEGQIEWESVPEPLRNALTKIILDNAKTEQRKGGML